MHFRQKHRRLFGRISLILLLILPSVSASIWDPFSLDTLKDVFVSYNNWRKNVNGSGFNISVDDYKTSEEGLEWIKPENIFDVDDEDIESDLNTYLDVGGDQATAVIGFNKGLNTTNITCPDGTCEISNLSTSMIEVDHIGEKTGSHNVVFDKNIDFNSKDLINIGTFRTTTNPTFNTYLGFEGSQMFFFDTDDDTNWYFDRDGIGFLLSNDGGAGVFEISADVTLGSNDLTTTGTIDLGTNTITDGVMAGDWDFTAGNLETTGTLTVAGFSNFTHSVKIETADRIGAGAQYILEVVGLEGGDASTALNILMSTSKGGAGNPGNNPKKGGDWDRATGDGGDKVIGGPPRPGANAGDFTDTTGDGSARFGGAGPDGRGGDYDFVLGKGAGTARDGQFTVTGGNVLIGTSTSLGTEVLQVNGSALIDNDLNVTGNFTGNIIYGNLNRGGNATITPTTLEVITGTLDSGDNDSVKVIDGTTLDVSEVTGTPGFNITFNFTNFPSKPRRVEYVGRYDGSVAHEVEIKILNHSSGDWNDINSETGDIPSNGENVFLSFMIEGETIDYLSNGLVSLQFIHTDSGNINHDIFIDFISLTPSSKDLPNVGQFAQITNYTTAKSNGVILDAPEGNMTMQFAGDYRVEVSSSFASEANSFLQCSVFKNSVEDIQLRFLRKLNVAGDIGSAALGGVLDVAVDDVLDLRCASQISDSFVTFANLDFYIERIGD